VVILVLFLPLKMLALADGDAKDEEDARSTKDILFDDVVCFVFSADFVLRVVRRKMTLVFDFNVTESLTIQRLVARVRSIFSLLLLLLLLLLLCCCCCYCHRGYQTWFTTRLFLLRPVSRGTSQTPRETLSRLARRVRPRVRTRLISPGYKIYLLSDQVDLE